ncbi:beta-N-acetylhexosaminidase [Pontibacter sp. JAM-7]|uniref:beta-N-acetylhexosaminidase n=1 Tax=Pontibacter sp. JAM-7 TaxID=3366581 RepID=UPI003AF9E6D1
MPDASLFLDLEGTSLTVEEEQLLVQPEISGVILFARNTENAEQVSQLTAQIRACNPQLVISIDQEGGRVQRLRQGVTRLPAVQTLLPGFRRSPDVALAEASQLGYLMAAELRQLDVDISFAPVLDIDYGHNEIIADRAFGDDVASVTALSGAYIRGMADAGMVATGKHFPGHGWVSADTHLADAIDERDLETLLHKDIAPFKSAIENGLEAMMLAHVLYPSCDDQPAGYSQFWLNKILRRQLDFHGVIFSDDLSMKAAHCAGDYQARSALAVDAGCQVLLCCNDRQGSLEVMEYLRNLGARPGIAVAGLRGRDWTIDVDRLGQARLLADRLLEASSG